MGGYMTIKTLLVFIFYHHFIFSCFQFLGSCSELTSIALGQSLTLNDTLVSLNRTFALGFFTPNGSAFVYLCIWYNTIPGRTAIWVANREMPILANDSGAVLKLSQDGSLAVLDGNGSRLWYSNSSTSSSWSPPASGTAATLSDDGKLVVSSNQVTYWNSFQDPSDTFLPDMRFARNQTSGRSLLWTSWKSASDPSAGQFSLGLSPDNPVQLFLLNGSDPIWRTGPLSGRNFAGVPNMSAFSIFGFNPSVDGDQFYLSLNLPSNVGLARFVVEPTAVVQQSIWTAQSQSWNVLWTQPGSLCDRYNWCGSFGLCNPNNKDICGCLPGFENGSSQARSGCVRTTQFGCDNGSDSSRFSTLKSVKPPDHGLSFPSVSNESACQAECLNNCSCTACIYTKDGTGCMMWFGELVDIEQFSGEGDGVTLFLRLAASDPVFETGSNNNHKHKRKLVVIYVTSILGAIICATCLYWLWRQKEIRLKEFMRKRIRVSIANEVGTSMTSSMGALDVAEPGRAAEENGEGLSLLDLVTVRAATDGFSSANKLGEGGFGPVYRGKLSGGQEIAVKRLSSSSGQGVQEFMNEVRLIAKLQHRNLVKLVGCCVEEEEKILVYEYMPNRSLDAFLFDDALRSQLEWGRRHTIVVGIARGLLYLHQDSRLRVIHCDLKASNILLDAAMNPKISDFGVARIFGGDQTQVNTRRVVGTYGYMSPEYAMEGRLSIKSDVFSFGVLVLEIVSGKRITRFQHPDLSLNLLGYAWKLWTEERALELLDPSLTASACEDQVLRCIHVGLLCVQDDPMDRPTMSRVVVMLGSAASNLPEPSMPAYSSSRTRRRPTTEVDFSSTEGDGGDHSINLVTVSTMEAR